LGEEEIRVSGLIVTSQLICDGCGRVVRHPERYGYVCEPGVPPLRICVECSREKGYLRQRKDERGHTVETFL